MTGSSPEPVRARRRLGWLLKHAHERWLTLSLDALRDVGVNGRELAVLTALAEGEPVSQLEAAQRLGIDRTSMVGLVDALEGKGLVERRPDARDRRRNIVAVTDHGSRVLAEGLRATSAAEQAFLAPLDADDADRLRRILGQVATADGQRVEEHDERT
jgi:DNA-binding MarR family transcriptional regulator